MTEGLSCTDCSTPFPAGVKKPRKKVLRCPSCRVIALRRHRAEYKVRNREETLAHARLYKLRHREHVRESFKDWYQRNLGYNKMRRDTDPQFRLRAYLRTRIYLALKGENKSEKTAELLGCPLSDLIQHLEQQFRPGMTWENYGPVWHVDHKRPCAAFDLSVPSQQRECFNFQNLQPLFAFENLSKGDKY